MPPDKSYLYKMEPFAFGQKSFNSRSIDVLKEKCPPKDAYYNGGSEPSWPPHGNPGDEDYWDGEWPPKPGTKQTYSLLKHIFNPIINEHNRYRHNFGMKPLRWSDHLAWAAQSNAKWFYCNGPHPEGSTDGHTRYGEKDEGMPRLIDRVKAAGVKFPGFKGNPAMEAGYPGGGGQPCAKFHNPWNIFASFRNEFKNDDMKNGHFTPCSSYGKEHVVDTRYAGFGTYQGSTYFVYSNKASTFDDPPPELEDYFFQV